jgi:hypothetical protein
MLLLFEVILIYAALATIAVSAVWLIIARKGFSGIQQSHSVLARALMGSVFAKWVKPEDCAWSVSHPQIFESTALPYAATTVVLATLLICWSGKPRLRISERAVIPCAESPIRASTDAPHVREIEELYADVH